MLLAQELGCNALLGMAIAVMGAYLGSQSTKGTCLSECYSSVMAQEIGPSIRAFAHRAVLDCSLRSLRCSLGRRRLRCSCRNGKALFRQLLLQNGGANIAESADFVVTRRRKPRLLPPPHPAVRD